MPEDKKGPPRDPVTGEEIPEKWRNYNRKQILQAKFALYQRKVGNPWIGWRPNTSKKYDPNDPHFNPFYPPEDTPKEVLEAFWGETFDDDDKERKGNALK